MNVISYYPKYKDLDTLLSTNKYKNINIYIDLKNIMTLLYTEYFVKYITENKAGRIIDTSIWLSLIEFLAFHKIYSLKRDIDIHFYIYYETGQSYYHLNISKDYKSNRKIDNLFGLDSIKREYFFTVIHKNLQLIEKTISLIPNVFVLHLDHLEADFIPYYLIKNNLVSREETLHLVYSNDHDLLQTTILDKENIFQFVRNRYGKKGIVSKMVSYFDVMTYYLKRKTVIVADYLPVIMSICGDAGDNVKNIKGIGPVTITKIINEFIDKVGGLDNLYKNVFDNKNIFTDTKTESKYIEKIILAEENEKFISKNLKLVSFELISRYLDNPVCTEMIDKKKDIIELLEKPKHTKYNILYEALSKLSIDCDSNTLDILFQRRQNIKENELLC